LKKVVGLLAVSATVFLCMVSMTKLILLLNIAHF